MKQVVLKSITPDFGTMEVIKMIGAKEERVAMAPGPDGKIIGEFVDGPETIDYSNLLLKSKPPAVQKKPACKKPAAAPVADATESDDDSSEEPKDSEADADGEDDNTAEADERALPEAPAGPEDREEVVV